MLCYGRYWIWPAFRNNFRQYCTDLRPITMAHTVLESPITDAWRPPLMIMHGLLGSKKNWRTVSKALLHKINRKIINLDARNHGDSPHSDEHSYKHMTADIVHLMQHMKLNKVSVMGHSSGGTAVMYMALKYPKLVESAVIIDTSPIAIPKDLYSVELILKAMRNLEVPKDLSLFEGRQYVNSKLQDVVLSRKTLEFVLLNLKKNPDGSFTWAFNVQSLNANLRSSNDFKQQISGLKSYKGPTMFICGKKSNFVDPKTWPDIQKIFPNSEMHWLNAGHLVHIEQPEKFIDLLVQFLK